MKNKEEKIRVLLVENGQYPRVVEINNTLEEMQKLVRGDIEPYYPYEETVCIVCNDEGKINGMSPNRAVYDEEKRMVELMCGPFFICDCSKSSFDSLTDEQIERYTKEFYYPQRFFMINGDITAFPYKPIEPSSTKGKKEIEREER